MIKKNHFLKLKSALVGTALVAANVFGQGGWTDNGSVVTLITQTDQVGIGTPVIVNGNTKFEVSNGAEQNTTNMMISNYMDPAYPYTYSRLELFQTRSTTPGVCGPTQDGDILGVIAGAGCNTDPGYSITHGAHIAFKQEGAPGSRGIAGRIEFANFRGDGSAITTMVIKPPLNFPTEEMGRVGIGTENPLYRLDVNGDMRVVGQHKVEGSLDVNGGMRVVGQHLVEGSSVVMGCLGVNVSTAGTQLSVRASYPAIIPLIVNSATSPTVDIARFQQNGTTKVVINKDGNVGISTTAPTGTTKLAVGGDAQLSTGSKLILGSVWIRSGAGAPSGSDGAPKGSLYLRTDGAATTTLYVKTGTTTYTAK